MSFEKKAVKLNRDNDGRNATFEGVTGRASIDAVSEFHFREPEIIGASGEIAHGMAHRGLCSGA